MLFHKPIFIFFGADSELMPKVMEYAVWIISAIPIFMTPVFISAFIRNDGAPGLAMPIAELIVTLIALACIKIKDML